MLTNPYTGESVEQQESHSLLVGVQNGPVIMENRSTVSYETKHALNHMI